MEEAAPNKFEKYFLGSEEPNDKTYNNCETIRKSDWVYWGEKNDFPNQLMGLMKGSSIHNAILMNRAHQISGLGLSFEEQKPASEKTAQFLKTINENGEEGNDILKKCALDFAIFSGICLAVTWSKNWQEIVKVEHVNFSKVRSAKVNEDGDVEGYFYSFDWSNSKCKPKFFPKFNASSAEDKGKEYKRVLKAFEEGDKDNYDENIFKGRDNTQLLYSFEYSPELFYYPSISYQGGLTAIRADQQLDIFSLSSLENGFSPSYMITFFKYLKEDAQKEVVRSFKKNLTGAKNANSILFSFAKTLEEKPQIDAIQSSNSDKQFVNISENIVSKILTAHSITNPILVGISIAGKLGGSSDIEQSQKMYFSNSIQPAMHHISKQFNRILEVNQLERVSIIPNDPFYVEKNTVVDGKEIGNNNDTDDLNTEKRKIEGENIDE